ncbi:hypothetical protein C8J57DRAFT_1220711 [Mycena rebaudengoi]|nr:hypothetical protein C8J57DRAFT_1220711 [Mycena rebaudengoi]
MSTTLFSDGRKPPRAIPLYEFPLTSKEKKKFTRRVEEMITKVKKEQNLALRKEKIEHFETFSPSHPQTANLKEWMNSSWHGTITRCRRTPALKPRADSDQVKSNMLKQGLSNRTSGGYAADMSVQSFTRSHSTLNMGKPQPDSHRIFDSQRGLVVDKNLYHSGRGSAPMPYYTPRIDPYKSQRGNQSSQSHLEHVGSAGSSIGNTTFEEFEAEQRAQAKWIQEQRNTRQLQHSYYQGTSAQAYHPTIIQGNDEQVPVVVPQGYSNQRPAIQSWRTASGEVWETAGAGWYRVQRTSFVSSEHH